MCVSVCVFRAGEEGRVLGGQTGKQLPRSLSHTEKTHALMISTASSTANMATRGKMQIDARDNIEGRGILRLHLTCTVTVISV